MIVHVVMFKLKPERKDDTVEIKRRLEALPAKVTQIRDYEVGVNMAESERAWDVSLYSTFDSMADMQAYQVNSDHQEVVAYIREAMEKSAVVDYEK